MDPNAGRFVPEEDAASWMPRFEVGEVLKVKGEEFEVQRIEERALILKPLSLIERRMREFSALAGIQDIREGLVNRQERRAQEIITRRTRKKEMR